MVMPRLPPEIWQDIFYYLVAEQAALAAVCLVSRDWYQAAVALLYHEPQIDSLHGLEKFAANLAPRNAASIKVLMLNKRETKAYVTDSVLQDIASAYRQHTTGTRTIPAPIQLMSLDLGGCSHVTDVGLVPLLALAGGNLTDVILNQCPISNLALVTLAAHSPNLRCLSLWRNFQLAPGCLLPFRHHRLHTLDLIGCHWLNHDVIRNELALFGSLRSLRLVDCDGVAASLVTLANILVGVEVLEITLLWETCDAEIANIVRAWRSVKVLRMHWTLAGEETVRAISEGMTSLEELDLRWCENIKEEMVRKWLDRVKLMRLDSGTLLRCKKL
ncbi:hypothetical protein BC938DRAFT_471683 [Jimgerdemannia flammicorona]|uniref:F-box domain-containing protein n=1 Tax=Jimgerdemannia flammicorona TaxID=994334 RepID=A0A433Q7M4_9FUNG|nr:hypothetical protein BC938DRAFT_471683 [Jimgerdemannia flammicorona]